MFNQLLNKILEDHPLLGLEKKDQNKGHLIGLKAPAWVHQGPVYEIFVRNFTPAGNFNDVRDKIPYLADLGVKTVWLMPIYPIGEAEKKGTYGSPYAIKDYTAIDPSLGTPADLKHLIDAVHRAGMRLILDLVANHMAADSVWRKNNPGYFLHDEQGMITRKRSEWSDVIDLDYSNPEVRTRMHKIISFWVREFDIDGFRCDVAGLVPLDFWDEVYKELVKIKNDIFLLAEWESAKFHPGAFHATYDWSTHFVLQDIFEGKRHVSDVVTWVMEKEANYPANALPMRFTENHDLDRTRKTFGEESFYPFVVFNFLVNGIPLIYCGQEFGLKKTPLLFEKDPIEWEQFDDQIFDFYKKVIKLRQTYPAFSSTKIETIGNDKPEQVVSIVKSDKDQKVLAILNFSNQALPVKLEISDFDHNMNSFLELFSNKKIEISEFRDFRIEPYGFYLLKPV